MAYEGRNQSFQGFRENMKYLDIKTLKRPSGLHQLSANNTFSHLHTVKLNVTRLFSQPPKTFASHEALPFSVSPEVKGCEVIKYSLSDQK